MHSSSAQSTRLPYTAYHTRAYKHHPALGNKRCLKKARSCFRKACLWYQAAQSVPSGLTGREEHRLNRAIQANLEWKVLLYSGKFTARSCHEPDLSQMPDFPFYAFLPEYLAYILTIKNPMFFKTTTTKKSFLLQVGRLQSRAEQSRRRNYTNLPAQPAGAWPAVNPLNSLLWSPFPAELGPDNRHGNKHKTARKKHPASSPQA